MPQTQIDEAAERVKFADAVRKEKESHPNIEWYSDDQICMILELRLHGWLAAKRAVLSEAKPVARLSEVQIDRIHNTVMQALFAEADGKINGGDMVQIAFPKRFAEAIMTALGSAAPCCEVCGDTGKWLAGYTGIFGGTVPVYETCKCAAPPAAEAKDRDIINAARNLVKVKGRYHSELAYKKLVDAIAAKEAT